MTKREAAIVSAYTGKMLGGFSDMHEYVTELLDREVWTHELADQMIVKEIRDKSLADFIAIEVSQ